MLNHSQPSKNPLKSQNLVSGAPLADRLRPASFEEFFGQEQIIGQDKLLRQLIEKDQLPSIIFWGPPGSGKTTLARLIANYTHSHFVSFSAVTAGVAELKKVIDEAKKRLDFNGQKTILFIDEIHRWNKAQQDALLPQVEDGTVVLIGATTENPSFEVNSALLSRLRVFVLEQLKEEDLIKIFQRALGDQERGLGKFEAAVDINILKYLATISSGDARVGLNTLELAVKAAKPEENGIIKLEEKIIKEALQKSHHLYDKAGEQHYNLISALHKSLRGSDANAGLYWLGRMLEAGEDPLYISRRLIRFACEDVGLANSRALEQAVAGYQACHLIGLPECNVILAQVVVYLAKCKKSNELYEAYQKVRKDVKETSDQPVPLHLRNAPTKLMKDLGYGKEYKYSPHYDYQEEQSYWPEGMGERRYLSDK